jgi:hypothetical protein
MDDPSCLKATQHPKILIGKFAEYQDGQVGFALERLAQLAANGKDSELLLFGDQSRRQWYQSK